MYLKKQKKKLNEFDQNADLVDQKTDTVVNFLQQIN